MGDNIPVECERREYKGEKYKYIYKYILIFVISFSIFIIYHAMMLCRR